MSFRWKGLLGVTGGGGTGSENAGVINNVNGSPVGGGVAAYGSMAGEQDWYVDPSDLPNMLGLENFGNTCYVNSVMQALYFCDPFREALLTHDGVADITETEGDESLFVALKTLFERMASASVPLSNVDDSATLTASTTSSFLGGGLSRKISSRPNTSSTRPVSSSSGGIGMIGAGALPITPSSVTQTPSISAKGGLNSCSTIVVPDTDIKTFLGSLKKSNILFDSTAHQDAHELFNFVLNRIGEDIEEELKAGMRGGSDRKTLVQRLFEGVLTNETRCLTCETVTSRDECFLDLSLDIERNSSVTACLRQFSAREMLCARNKFFCDTCSGLQEAEKRMKIKKLPNVLALHLKRFKYEESVQRFVKLAYRVVFPMQLRLFNTSDDAYDPDKLYELYGIIVHIGAGPHHGHYVAIIKVGERWFVFDDETISVIDEQDLSRYYGDTPGSGSAYVLFYQAVDLDMQSLGLPDVKAMRAEKARARREASLRKRATPLASPTTMNGASDWPNHTPHETPSRSVTPSNEGRTGGLFGRRSNTVSGSLAGTLTGSTAMATTLSSGELQSDSSTKASGSWLNSLRGRKGSVSQNNGLYEADDATDSSARQPSPSASRRGGPGHEAGEERAERSESEAQDVRAADRKVATPARRATNPIPSSDNVDAGDDGNVSAANANGGWRKVTGISPRKPADPPAQQQSQASTKRRSTLSRAFGFGRKDQ